MRPMIFRFRIRLFETIAKLSILFGIVILGAYFYLHRSSTYMDEMSLKNRTFKAVLSGQIALPLAPENISSIPLYHVHKNLWGTLLSDRGAPGLGRLIKTSSDGKSYQIEILPNARFSDGRKITSKDIIFSFRRLIEKQPSGHFNAKAIIDRIEEASNSSVNIVLHTPSAAFLFLLSIPEMGIVPPDACDENGNILNFQVTSGPYSVYGTPSSDKIVLTKNSYFSSHVKESPDKVILFFRRTKDEMIRTLQDEGADFLEAYDGAGIEALQALKSDPAFSNKVTRPSYSVFIVASLENLTERSRKALSALYFERLPKIYHPLDNLEERSHQILPPGTFGSIKNIPDPGPISARDLPKHIRLATVNRNTLMAKAVIQVLIDAGISVEVTNVTTDLTHTDLIFCGQGMNTDFPEIEFQLSMLSSWAYIPASSTDRDFVTQALHSNNKAFRMNLIEKIGRQLLEDGRIIPLYVRSYAHLYRKNSVDLDNMTNYDGDILLWKTRILDP